MISKVSLLLTVKAVRLHFSNNLQKSINESGLLASALRIHLNVGSSGPNMLNSTSYDCFTLCLL